jgi:hypothetical protein
VKDYGSAAYALPLHIDYLKRTLAHSTIMIDGNCQLESQGALELFGIDFPEFAQILSSTLGPINANVTARRTLIEIPQGPHQVIVVDLLEAIPYNIDDTQHDYFYVLHSSGRLQICYRFLMLIIRIFWCFRRRNIGILSWKSFFWNQRTFVEFLVQSKPNCECAIWNEIEISMVFI